jgi:hypothetical protein
LTCVERLHRGQGYLDTMGDGLGVDAIPGSFDVEDGLMFSAVRALGYG